MNRILVAFVVALLACCANAGAVQGDASAGQIALHEARQDVAVAAILQKLRSDAPQGLIVFRNVRIVDPAAASVTPNQAVIVQEQRIVWVGDDAKLPRLPKATYVDGAGRYLVPGLTDMHVHSSTASGWLLELANGVTAVRDMAGFPWMLQARDAINSGRMLAPVLSVAGPLITGFPMEGFAVIPASSLDARRMVRQQAACGYDFIKVHNVVPLPIFDAVAQQAHALGMDLVGHVPHDIPVRHAVAAGMRTMEHLKGFINDRTLQPGETDFAAAVDGPEVWNTPTLYAGRGYAYGDEARRLLASPEMRYVPLRKREEWRRALDQPVDDGQKLGHAAGAIMKDIVGKLHVIHARFLAGTDADGYPYTVMGYALVAELGLLQDAGLSPAEALQAATTEPARAMHEENEIGTIRRGARADLILLDGNPLESARVFARNNGVMAHGTWMDRARLDAALDGLVAIQAEPDAAQPFTNAAAGDTMTRAESLKSDGFVFDSRLMTELATQLRKQGWNANADRADALADVPTVGPCVDIRPR